ncbi:MAG: helix-turn-helix transcriptional regulator [Clostridia bacterium]|nr:helix-turn-helix transcriptional regulator [Clostridia bacterium]
MSFPYTRLSSLTFVRCAFAHSVATVGYRYELKNEGWGIYGKAPRDGGLLEIGFVEQNPILLTGEKGERFRIGENCIFIIPPDSRFSVQCENEGLHRHTTAEFLVRCHTKAQKEYLPPAGRSLTLPLVIEPSPLSGEVFDRIRAIATAKAGGLERSFFEDCGDFMHLIHSLSRLAEPSSTGTGQSPGARRHCERAKAFISEHIDRHLTVSDVAEAVGVSKNYLTNVFSATEGVPLMEYINRRKLSHMVELIRRYDYSLSQAGEQVGFSDTNYVSRMFRRYYGMTFTQFKQQRLRRSEAEKNK